ncbi:hypothetical protein Gohar_004488 [Gossypium harknessii]|uniref:RNase H type-1 domain-containing protein n=3 Tax=Gossypium TaxID=3633 RepID=A0A7J9H7M9_9ROSI|nr:hypothetical protein [Gossypium harknessii]
MDSQGHRSETHGSHLLEKTIKINFDVGFNRDLFRSSSGIVARKGRGRVVVSRATIYENVNSAFAAEAHACLEAVRMG